MSLKRDRAEISRRDLIKTLSATGIFAGVSGLLQSCAYGSSNTSNPTDPELRTLHFDHGHLKPDMHDFALMVGSTCIRLETATVSSIQEGQNSNRFLSLLPSVNITHHARGVRLPGDKVQLCYIRRTPKGMPNASWELAGQFLHIPAASVLKAHSRRTTGKLALKAQLYGLSFRASSPSDVLGERDVITPADFATSYVFMHPELMSMEPDSAAHISANIIGNQASTTVLAQVIQQQGGDWMTNSDPFINTDTGKPYVNKQGQPITMPIPSDNTMQFGGTAINDSLTVAKQDTSLGGNVSDTTDTKELTGKIWTIQDGTTYTKTTALSGRTTGRECAGSGVGNA